MSGLVPRPLIMDGGVKRGAELLAQAYLIFCCNRKVAIEVARVTE